MKKRKGFTLVELLVVIAILAILATASIVGYTAFTGRAKESNLKSELTQLRQVLIGEDENNDAFAIGEEVIAFDTVGQPYYYKVTTAYAIDYNGDLTNDVELAVGAFISKSTYLSLDAQDEAADFADHFAEVETEAETWEAILTLNDDLKDYVDGTKRLELFSSRKAIALVDDKEKIVVVWTIGEQELGTVDYTAYQSMH